VSVTQVTSDKIPMNPGSGMQPRVIVTIQPAGARFDPPAPVTFPNVDGLPAGTVAEMFSFDHDLGEFVSIGTGTVSEDGRVVRSDPGFGIVKAGWHCAAPQSPGGESAPLVASITSTNPTVVYLEKGTVTPVEVKGRAGPIRDSEYRWILGDSSIATLSNAGGTVNSPDVTTMLTPKKVGKTTLTLRVKCKTNEKFVEDTIEVEVVRVYDITVSAFIPFANALPPLVGVTATPCSSLLPALALGENRGFQANATSFRLRQTAKVAPRLASIFVTPPTRGTSASSSAKQTQTTCTCQNSNSGMQVPTATRISKDTVRIDFVASGATCLTPPLVTPTIDWCFSIVLTDPETGSATYEISGGNDNFPAYEVYVGGQLIHGFMPSANNALLLIGDCNDVPISPPKSGTLQ